MFTKLQMFGVKKNQISNNTKLFMGKHSVKGVFKGKSFGVLEN